MNMNQRNQERKMKALELGIIGWLANVNQLNKTRRGNESPDTTKKRVETNKVEGQMKA